MFFCPKGLFGCVFCSKGLFGSDFGDYWECCPVLTLHIVQNLGLVFGWETEGIWTHVLHRSYRCNCELDVRLLNNPNWTFTSQVMDHFIPGDYHSLGYLIIFV